MAGLVTLDAIQQAAKRIGGIVRRTPVLDVSHSPAPPLWLKCENLQLAGAFKIRGALNMVGRLEPSASGRGVITYSSGNHGRAVAFAARLAGFPATVVMPVSAHHNLPKDTYARSNRYDIWLKHPDGAHEVVEDIATPFVSQPIEGYATPHLLKVKLQPGSTMLTFAPRGSAGVGGYMNGRTIELVNGPAAARWITCEQPFTARRASPGSRRSPVWTDAPSRIQSGASLRSDTRTSKSGSRRSLRTTACPIVPVPPVTRTRLTCGAAGARGRAGGRSPR